MKLRLPALAAAGVVTVCLLGCGPKEKAAPVPPDDAKYASPAMKTGPAPGGAAGGAPSTSAPSAPSTQ